VGFLDIAHSPLAQGPARIRYRAFGDGVPLVFLHGGWGYSIYPLDERAPELRGFRILIPDRSGYGGSTKPVAFAADFHQRAATETVRFLDALRIERCVLWGHSDGAVIAAQVGLAAPERCGALILEAFHYWRGKPGSRVFFEGMARNPDSMAERVTRMLAQEHGEPYWRELIRRHSQAWLDLAGAASRPDLYDGALGRLAVPALFLHGSRDPRTEPGEIDAVRRELPQAAVHMIEGAGHCPHSETPSAGECYGTVREFLTR
jgi:pimeloyl-ACP methyl ester carboxylesterase